jgi:hypothetical protein
MNENEKRELLTSSSKKGRYMPTHKLEGEESFPIYRTPSHPPDGISDEVRIFIRLSST